MNETSNNIYHQRPTLLYHGHVGETLGVVGINMFTTNCRILVRYLSSGYTQRREYEWLVDKSVDEVFGL
jgi:hypothetical protein